MELSDYTSQPCRTEMAIEFLPKKQEKLDLALIAKTLRSEGLLVEIETPVFLSIKVLGKNVSLFKSGKIMVKEMREQEPARKIAEELLLRLSKKEVFAKAKL